MVYAVGHREDGQSSSGNEKARLISLPPAATQEGDAWFTVVNGEGWVITNRAALFLGRVRPAAP